MTGGEREQRVIENLAALYERGDEHMRLIVRIQMARLLPGSLVQPHFHPSCRSVSLPVRRGKWWQL